MTADLHSLMAPYALDALDALERARFEAHLVQCSSCQSELTGFVATAVRLGDAAEAAPPAALRERLMAEVATTRQDRPVVPALAKPGLMRRTLPRLAMAAAFLVGAVGVGGYLNEHRELDNERADREVITAVMAAADAVTVEKSFDDGGHVRLISSDQANAAYIVARDLPSPGEGKVYQVWIVGEELPRSEGVFERSGEMIMQDIADADRIAVTIEPEGGSKQPTTPPVATIAV